MKLKLRSHINHNSMQRMNHRLLRLSRQYPTSAQISVILSEPQILVSWFQKDTRMDIE